MTSGFCYSQEPVVITVGTPKKETDLEVTDIIRYCYDFNCFIGVDSYTSNYLELGMSTGASSMFRPNLEFQLSYKYSLASNKKDKDHLLSGKVLVLIKDIIYSSRGHIKTKVGAEFNVSHNSNLALMSNAPMIGLECYLLNHLILFGTYYKYNLSVDGNVRSQASVLCTVSYKLFTTCN